MNLPLNLSNKLNLLIDTLHFFEKHFLVITGLGLIAAFGRVIQLGGFGQITTWMNIVLEVGIESSRILLFLYVLSLANIKNGALRIKHLFSNKDNQKLSLIIAIKKFKKQWYLVVLNIIGFY